jgi:hypothetical protein
MDKQKAGKLINLSVRTSEKFRKNSNTFAEFNLKEIKLHATGKV